MADVSIRNDLLQKIWRGVDPFAGFPTNLYHPDPQGWGSTHPYLVEGVHQMRPRIAAEVGVWKGSSTKVMATEMKRLGLDGVFISIDTWLGAWDHWNNPEWFPSLAIEHGQPMIMRTFMANMVEAGLQDIVLPLPLDSVNASEVFRHYDIELDLLHLDGGHDYQAVASDLNVWWPRLRPGGLLIGDDYVQSGEWPGLRKAFDEFFGERGLGDFEFGAGKMRIRKPL